jgi:hypothetical protein
MNRGKISFRLRRDVQKNGSLFRTTFTPKFSDGGPRKLVLRTHSHPVPLGAKEAHQAKERVYAFRGLRVDPGAV